MSKHPNYEMVEHAAEIVNQKRQEISQLSNTIFIVASNKLGRKKKVPIPSEIIELNGSENLVLRGNKVWYEDIKNGLKLIIDDIPTKETKQVIQRFNDMWNSALSQASQSPISQKYPGLIFTRKETSGGDLFVYDSGARRLLGWYRWELKTGETRANSMPYNSLCSASQAIHGEVEHEIVDGLIVLKGEVLTTEERDAAMLVRYIKDRFNSFDNLLEIAEKCEKKATQKRDEGEIRQIPMIHYEPSSRSTTTYNVNGTSIASRTTNLKLEILKQSDE